ncbi:hypothetical protein [Parabacteroides sp.]
MNCNKSLLNREYSAWIKGLLTLFIILGHNMVFTIPLNEYGAMSFFYLFHIQGFFILPFLYGVDTKPYTLERIKDTVIRFYWPYGILVTCMMLGVGATSRFSNVIGEGLSGLYLFCDAASIKRMCGIQIFWFLPSMMMTVLLKELYYRTNSGVRISLFTCSVAFILCVVYANSSFQARASMDWLIRYLPFGAGYAVQMLAMGVTLRALIGYIEKTQGYRSALALSASGFLVCSMLYMEYVARLIGHSDLNVVYAVLRNITPVLFMVMIVSALELLHPTMDNSMVLKLGQRSLYVYLISPFIGYIVYFVCDYLNGMYWWIGLLLWPMIAFTAYCGSLLIKGKVERILFPRNLYALIQVLKVK